MAPQFKGAGGSGFFYRLGARAPVLRRAVIVAGGTASAAGVACLARVPRPHEQQQPSKQQQQNQLGPAILVPRGLAEVICGAVGEIVQVACLYPLDTIKVRCQATGAGAGRVVAGMLRTSGGLLSPALWRQLYAGVVGASVLSVAVGALYYSSFCAAKRLLLRTAADGERRAAAAAATAGVADALPLGGITAAGAAAAVVVGRGQGQQMGHHAAHGSPVDLHHDAVVAMVCCTEAAAERRAARAGARAGGNGALAAAAGATATGLVAVPAPTASSEADEESISSGGRLRANMLAAAAAALVGAVVEAPVELFKHRLQAGSISGSIVSHMASAVRAGGPGALFVSMLPFCAKSLPFDSAELLTYSTLSDTRDLLLAEADAAGAAGSTARGPREWLASAAAASRGSPLADLGLGAAAGAVAVLMSQPMDTVKTVVETGGAATLGVPGTAGGGPRALARTARALIAARGPGALFAGTGMRLAEQVPSTALYWIAVEAMRRALEPYVAK